MTGEKLALLIRISRQPRCYYKLISIIVVTFHAHIKQSLPKHPNIFRILLFSDQDLFIWSV